MPALTKFFANPDIRTQFEVASALASPVQTYLDHRFSASVGDRPFTVNGRRVESDDPFVLRQFKKFYALRVGYSLALLVLLFVVVSHVG